MPFYQIVIKIKRPDPFGPVAKVANTENASVVCDPDHRPLVALVVLVRVPSVSIRGQKNFATNGPG